jgi:hypothetical protein
LFGEILNWAWTYFNVRLLNRTVVTVILSKPYILHTTSESSCEKLRVPRAREEDDTYVIDRLISHARYEEDSCWLLRVRWAACGPDDDTWEPALELPEELVRKYERRKSLSWSPSSNRQAVQIKN